jgi:hypothetical protein
MEGFVFKLDGRRTCLRVSHFVPESRVSQSDSERRRPTRVLQSSSICFTQNKHYKNYQIN